MLMIVPYATDLDLEDILRLFKIYVRILDEEYRNKIFTGRAYFDFENAIKRSYEIKPYKVGDIV